MHWISMLGVLLIAAGVGLTFVGQGIRARSDTFATPTADHSAAVRYEELQATNQLLSARIGEFRKSVSEKEKAVTELRAQLEKLSRTSLPLTADGRVAVGPNVFVASELSDGIQRAKELFNKGRLDEAYHVAEALRSKKPDFGLAYFLLGTIEVQRGRTEVGTELLSTALQLELPDDDKARAYHNLGIVAMRSNDLDGARRHFEQALLLNPQMEESKRNLRSLLAQTGG